MERGKTPALSDLLDFPRCGCPCHHAPFARRSLCRPVQHVLLGLFCFLQLLFSNREDGSIRSKASDTVEMKLKHHIRRPTRSSFSFSFSDWWISHCSCTYSRNFRPLTRNSRLCSSSQPSIWALRTFSSWDKREWANWALYKKWDG